MHFIRFPDPEESGIDIAGESSSSSIEPSPGFGYTNIACAIDPTYQRRVMRGELAASPQATLQSSSSSSTSSSGAGGLPPPSLTSPISPLPPPGKIIKILLRCVSLTTNDIDRFNNLVKSSRSNRDITGKLHGWMVVDERHCSFPPWQCSMMRMMTTTQYHPTCPSRVNDAPPVWRKTGGVNHPRRSQAPKMDVNSSDALFCMSVREG